MNDAAQEMVASVPADATPELLRATLGDPPSPRQPDAEQAAQLESFGLDAVALQRLSIQLLAAQQSYFWHADDILTGLFTSQAAGAGMLPEAVARTLSQALARLLDAAEAASHAHLTSLQITRPPADNDRLVLEWLSDGPEAAVSELPADAGEAALAAEASEAYG